ncbi:MAG: polysaccharide deacetylase family protein [Candidatus Latescibacteria bacterium]|nr:polysaccharide deacetylase family protein [Candidatus Latescibacterota bacterium]
MSFRETSEVLKTSEVCPLKEAYQNPPEERYVQPFMRMLHARTWKRMISMTEKLLILVYHRVHADGDRTAPDDHGRIGLSEFQRQMDCLKESGFQTVTHREIATWLYDGIALPERAVAIDFDDNRLHVFENALPVLTEHGFKATVFVITELAGGNPVFGPNDYPAMRWRHLEQLRDQDWCIAPHTRHHLHLAGPQRTPRDEAEIWDELAGSRQIVEERLGITAPYFAYPSGSWNEAIEAQVRKVFRTARHWHQSYTGSCPINTRKTNPYRLAGVNVCDLLSFERFRLMVDLSG